MSEILKQANTLKHDIQKRNFNTALSRAALVKHLLPDSKTMKTIMCLLSELDQKIKQLPEYKRLLKLNIYLMESINERGITKEG